MKKPFNKPGGMKKSAKNMPSKKTPMQGVETQVHGAKGDKKKPPSEDQAANFMKRKVQKAKRPRNKGRS